MIIKRIMIIGALFSLSFNLFAASSAEDCAAITGDSKRLKCYDEFLKQKQTQATETKKAEPEPEKTVAPAEPEEPAVAQPEPKQSAEDKFGEEHLSKNKKKDKEDANEIHSRAIGKFKMWEKGMVIELENGQAWEITDYRSAYHMVTNPKITIEKGLFNSYRLGIEGLNKRFRVKRKK